MPKKTDEVVLNSVREQNSDEYEFVTPMDLMNLRVKFTLIPEKPQSDGKMYVYRYLKVPR